jgi:hypothetical protein
MIQRHVEEMKRLLNSCADGNCRCRPHNWDSLFDAVYANADKIGIQVEKLPDGVSVTETGSDAFSQALIKAHAKVVSSFVKEGHAAAMRTHAVPDVATSKPVGPWRK